ncbi:MAG TPA: hypothetical protein VK689_10855, partial [Armatimonadota bacterium]|nr:hypothetical protein [Armatimonadota bacterium]
GVPVQAAGLRIVGWNDPAAQRAGFGDPDPTAADLEQYRLGIEQWVARGEPADVLVLHHYAPAEGLAGKAPVVLFGHDHRARVEQREGSVLVDAGTTGAAGLRYLTSPTRPPFSAAVLQFSAGIAPRLEAVDLIHLRDPNGDFTVERTTVNGARARPGP